MFIFVTNLNKKKNILKIYKIQNKKNLLDILYMAMTWPTLTLRDKR